MSKRNLVTIIEIGILCDKADEVYIELHNPIAMYIHGEVI